MGTQLWDALDYLREHGWHQGHYTDINDAANPTPSACILGALKIAQMEAVGNVFGIGYGYDIQALISTIEEQHPDVATDAKEQDYTLIPFFNDGKGRTFAEVERVIEKAAIKRDEAF